MSRMQELKQQTGRHVRIEGWVHAVRSQKRMQFLIVRLGTELAQAAVDGRSRPDLAERVARLSRESVVRVSGTVLENAQVGLGGVEIHAESVDVLSAAEPGLPVDPSASDAPGPDTRADWRFLDLRRPVNRLVFEIQTEAERAMRVYWAEHGFIEIHTPKLMAAASESGAELFEVGYFGERAFLAQSPQFYKQMAMAAGFDRVFEIAPVFRANPSFTSRHDTEFTSVDVEIAWIDSHEDVMRFEERWLAHVLTHLSERYGSRIADHFGVEVVPPSVPFPRVTMAEALRLLAERGHTPDREGDLDPAGERLLSEIVAETYGHEFVFVTDYPASVRPFYHMRPESTPGLTKSFDLIWKGLEVTTGAQREHRRDILIAQALEKGLSEEGIRFYLDFFRYGCPPHGGFGFGLTRMLMVLLGLPAVRDATFLVRTPNRLTP